MLTSEVVLVGAAHFLFVFFKAFQQRNVAFLHYWWVYPISFCMSSTEVVVLSVVAVKAVQMETFTEMIPYVLSLGIGGGTGAIVAMWTHNKFIGKKR